jgi:hypothetical protein
MDVWMSGWIVAKVDIRVIVGAKVDQVSVSAFRPRAENTIGVAVLSS